MTLDQRNAMLEKKLGANPIDKSIATLIEDAKRRNRQIVALAVSLFLDLLLTLGLAYVSFQTQHTAKLAQNNSSAVIASCNEGNTLRKTERDLWNYILELQPPRDDTLTEDQLHRREQIISDFRGYLAVNFVPQDCSKIIKEVGVQ